MIKIDDEYIKSLPLVTNRIKVTWNKENFFSKYSIVSYYSKNKEYNLPYEQLADLPCLSVTGIWARWDSTASVRFFILANKGTEQTIRQSLQTYDDIKSRIDDLDDYEGKTVQRIIASLAINALGKRHNETRVYNGGALLICDDDNFGVDKSKEELVCLRIEVNEYLNLTAKTNTFTHPHTNRDLMTHRNCVFQICDDIEGILWAGQSVKPVVIGRIQGNYNLNEFYIKEKRFSDRNLVPYWPYDKEKYTHGRLFAITQVLETVNELFSHEVNIQFVEFPVLHYDDCETGETTLDFIRDGLGGNGLFIDDPFKTDGSKKMIESLVRQMTNFLGDAVSIHKKQHPGDMIIKLCEPASNAANVPNVYYEQSLTRLMRSDTAIQHCIYDDSKKVNTVNKSTARRILIELLVKYGIIKKSMPQELESLIERWTFTRYKIIKGGVHGASLSIENGEILFKEHGLSSNQFGEDFETFCRDQLLFSESELIKGSRDYMAMEKDGNVFLIVDTDEIPILDANLIDEGYGKVINEGETISMFKRKKVVHEYLRGYIGFHLWKTDGLHGEPEGSYSYISGTNIRSVRLQERGSHTMMDRMPRARRIFILHAAHPEKIEDEVYEIASMLKFGFGRWNEIMTYPFPFKYLYEYLDNVCETRFCEHWKKSLVNYVSQG